MAAATSLRRRLRRPGAKSRSARAAAIIKRGEGGNQQQRERGPADPVLAHQGGRDEAREPGRGRQAAAPASAESEQRAPAQAALAEISERRPRRPARPPSSVRRLRRSLAPARRRRLCRRCWVVRVECARLAGLGVLLMRASPPAGTRSPGRAGCAAVPAPRRTGPRAACAAAGSAGNGRCIGAPQPAAGLQQARRVLRQVAREYRGLCARRRTPGPQALARHRHADDARQPLPARAPPPRASP